MIIGIDASQALRARRTGVEWYSYHLLRELKSAAGLEHEVRLYSSMKKSSELAPLPHHWQWRRCFWPFRYGWTGLRLAHELHVRPPDVFFSPGYRIPAHGSVPSVVTIHDIAFKIFPKAYANPRLVNTIHWTNVKRATLIITPSHATADDMMRYYQVPESKIRIVPHGIDQFIYRCTTGAAIDTVLKKFGVRQPFLLSIGRLEEKKNVIATLAAISSLRKETGIDYQMIMVGARGHGYENIASWIRKHHAESWAREMGWMPSQEVVCLMNRAAAYVTMSRAEGFALTILEAFACGTPVVASDISAHREVGGGLARIVDAAQPSAVAAGIAEEVKKTSDAAREARIARASEYPWRRTAEETLKVLLEAGTVR